MSEHLASMNEHITSQNDKIDRLQQQSHPNPKVIRENIFEFFHLNFFYFIGWKKRQKMK
jgi:hypothetical protein